ncbi:heme exporter protein CcmC [Maricaulis maris MCS10]|uniref:Heme exporter protein C n=1 Tax=Maricaulis maris (strain MCS10) TaxID=394221 RepID=Q0AKQ4_MARMM|nr:heme ABC transporter permease CcmC [Maricaulis maris]ABI67139.1 heme exporter protein CcmC [Maricaulis maris MCS10]
MLSYFSNPQRFDQLARALIPVFGVLAVLLLAVGVWLALLGSPPDYQQGETIRIMYVHVPAAYMAMALYAALAVASFVYFVWRHALADTAAEIIAPIGAVFTVLALFTGSLWGKPMWGTWWEWDARMTSVLVLLLVYLGYMALRAALEDTQQAARTGAVLAMAGIVNLVIVKFSVDWWSSLHQPASIIRLDGPTIHASQLWPLLVMILAYTCFAGWLVLYRLRSQAIRRRVRTLQRQREQAARAREEVVS